MKRTSLLNVGLFLVLLVASAHLKAQKNATKNNEKKWVENAPNLSTQESKKAEKQTLTDSSSKEGKHNTSKSQHAESSKNSSTQTAASPTSNHCHFSNKIGSSNIDIAYLVEALNNWSPGIVIDASPDLSMLIKLFGLTTASVNVLFL